MRSALAALASRRSASVFGYQREARPLPFSPAFVNVVPGARMLLRRVRLSTSVRKPHSSTSLGVRSASSFTAARETWNRLTFSASAGPCCKAACQKAAMSRSSSSSRARSAQSAIRALRETLPPPQKGSTSRAGRGSSWRIQALAWGLSHVLPPGYLSGLRCGTEATFAAGLGEAGNPVRSAGSSAGARSKADQGCAAESVRWRVRSRGRAGLVEQAQQRDQDAHGREADPNHPAQGRILALQVRET